MRRLLSGMMLPGRNYLWTGATADMMSSVRYFRLSASGPLKNRNKTVKLHIFIDKCSIEVFGNDGETVISSKIYPGSMSTGITLFSNNGKVKVKSLELWELDSIDLY